MSKGDRWKRPRYCVGKFPCLIGFTQGRFVTVSIDETIGSVAGRKHEGNTTLPQNVGDGERLDAGQIYVKHGKVDLTGPGELERLVDTAG